MGKSKYLSKEFLKKFARIRQISVKNLTKSSRQIIHKYLKIPVQMFLIELWNVGYVKRDYFGTCLWKNVINETAKS